MIDNKKIQVMTQKQLLNYIWSCVQKKQINRDEFDKLVKMFSDIRSYNLKMSGKRYEDN
jgi:hypothetical protein